VCAARPESIVRPIGVQLSVAAVLAEYPGRRSRKQISRTAQSFVSDTFGVVPVAAASFNVSA
jgi:hypothetical protein